MNKPNKYIIHHSLTDDNKVLSDFKAIKNYHINVKGWNDIGYHDIFEYEKGKLVHRDGRKTWVNGAHTLGQNTKSLGVCLVGNYDKDTPTQEQYNFIAETLCKKYHKTCGYMPFYGHREYSIKTCPGRNFSIKAIEEKYREYSGVKKVSGAKEVTKLYPLQIIELCALDDSRWKKGYNAIINMTKESSELGVLEPFKYLPELIIKLYYAVNKNYNLKPIQMIGSVVDYTTEWNNAYSSILELIRQDSNLGDLEIFNYFPELVKKVYCYSKK